VLRQINISIVSRGFSSSNGLIVDVNLLLIFSYWLLGLQGAPVVATIAFESGILPQLLDMNSAELHDVASFILNNRFCEAKRQELFLVVFLCAGWIMNVKPSSQLLLKARCAVEHRRHRRLPWRRWFCAPRFEMPGVAVWLQLQRLASR
jgi:hypothetical protein